MLLKLLSLITGTREKVIPQWSSKSYVHNIFRLWELVAGRKWGVRAEASAVIENGKIYYYFYTWEAALAHFEGWIRNAFKLKPFKVYVPMLATPTGIPVPASPYLFAIAWDNSMATGSSPISYTVTGSNPLMTSWIHDISGSNNVSAVSYNAVALTKQDQANSTGGHWATSWMLVAPATGSNSWSKTGGGTNQCINSYSGCLQTGQPDAHGATTGSSNSPSRAITTIAANCVVSGAISYDNSSALTSPSNLSNPADNSANSASIYSGNSATQASPGSVTQSATLGSSTTWAVLQISIAPTATTTNGNFLAFM